MTRPPPTEIPHRLQRMADDHFERYAQSQQWDEAERAQWRFDRIRFAKTLQWLDLLGLDGSRVLELGDYSIASFIFRAHCSTSTWSNTDFDLRDPFPIADHSFDALVSTEVIEHISDRDFFAASTFDGVRHVLRESRRVLRPGGLMLLSTPNAHSTWAIQRALLCQPPLLYDHHYREYTVDEICALLTEAGFEPRLVATERVWHHWDFRPIERFMADNGYALDRRGDDTFLLAGNPG